jgi:hypothetical protein
MTFRFAHLADLHVGAWRERALSEIGLSAARAAFERCIEEQVDFIVIAGDLFDATLPDMAHVRETAEILRRVREAGIPVYATYGSHDYSPSSASVIDVLEASGLFVKLMASEIAGEGEDALVRPRFIVDEGTGAKLAGLSGRQRSLEREYYRRLDHACLEAEPGFKVFVFHSALDEVLPEHERHAESMPRSFLPPGFDYYAGGHIHTRIEAPVPGGRGLLAYPGPLLGHQYGDLERTRDAPRGFYIVTADETVTDLAFVEVPLPPVILHDLPADGRTAGEVALGLDAAVGSCDHQGAIVLIRARGTLAAGDPREVPFGAAREALEAQGALCVKLSRSGLTGPTTRRARGDGPRAKHEIEARVIAERCAAFHPDPALDVAVRDVIEAVFEAEAGTETGRRVLEAVAVEPVEGEAGRSFAGRVRERAGAVLPGLGEER